MGLAFNMPLNNLSLGQVSINLLREARKENLSPSVFPISQIDLGAFNGVSSEFQEWLQGCTGKAGEQYSRKTPCLKLWHVSGLLESFSDSNYAYTFHETSSLTPTEFNILSQQKKVFVSSKYTKQIFENSGLTNVVYAPLGFDTDFHRTDDESMKDVITFGLRGKLEKRKHTLKILKCWAKQYGNDKNYRLNCSIHNPFLDPKMVDELIINTFEGNVPWNINFLPHFPLNSEYNKILNSADIELTGLSGCEGFNLPLFQSLCLGRQAVVLNAHVHKDFCNQANSVLVEPSGLLEANDGVFFHKGQAFNQGMWFDFDEDDAISAMKVAEKKAKERNEAGELLKGEFTYEKMLNTIIENIET